MNLLKIFLQAAFLILTTGRLLYSEDLKITSPSGNIEVYINHENVLRYQVFFNGVKVLNPSEISFNINKITIGKESELISSDYSSVDEEIIPVVKENKAIIKNNYNQLRLAFKNNFEIIFLVFDDAVAYRLVTSFEDSIKIFNEKCEYNFADNYKIYYPAVTCREDADCFHTSFEENYSHTSLSDIDKSKMAFLPVLVEEDSSFKAVITEADLYDYPGMFVKASENPNTIEGIFAGFPLEEKIAGGEFKELVVTKRADYIAGTKGTRNFPWRILILAENESGLLNNDVVYKLSEPSAEDFSWVKPGKSTEEWIISRNLYGVDFKSGINTATYKYYIDFASEYNLEYVMLDAGWSVENDLLKVVPELDMQEILSYAKQKNVGIILWCLSLSVRSQMREAFEQFERWGVKGIMVDFMDRDDQLMVNYYENVLKEAAKRKLFVNFHGAFKQTGLQRKYPNQVTREGVLGHEFNMWSDRVTPDHLLTIPFLRMVAGPMDDEGGSMRNAQQKDFRAVFEKPMSQGTRTMQLAQYVVFISPLQYLAGNPSDYLREPEFTKLLAGVPTTWDETKVIDAKIGDYIIIARRHNDTWYAAAMTDWTPRSFEINLSFLDDSEYDITICEDGINADKYAEDYKIKNSSVNKNDKLKINLAPGGGWFAEFTKKK